MLPVTFTGFLLYPVLLLILFQLFLICCDFFHLTCYMNCLLILLVFLVILYLVVMFAMIYFHTTAPIFNFNAGKSDTTNFQSPIEV